MANPFDGLNDAFGNEPSELQKHVEKVKPTLKKTETEDVKQDYETTRAQLHNLVMKGQEAVDGILDVARASDHPRAYEKKMKELDAEEKKSGPSTVNNTMFVGSTAELQKMLKKQKEINNTEDT
jgi:NADPH-dependent glutamate synthase beta subunit-like oxidoreductase